MEEEKNRLEQFKEFVEMDPNDTFSRYALAMEYMGISDFENAVFHFQKLLDIDPAYSSAYFQAAIAMKQTGKIDDAKGFLRKGIEVADGSGDWHARDEMKAALQDLE